MLAARRPCAAQWYGDYLAQRSLPRSRAVNGIWTYRGKDHCIRLRGSRCDPKRRGSAAEDFEQVDITETKNTAIGANAGLTISTGTSNTIVGNGALDAENTGSENVAIGNNALGAATGGVSN